MVKRLIFALLFLNLTASAQIPPTGVAYVDIHGSDSSSGNSPAMAKATPQVAMTALHNSAAGGGTVYLAAGQYPCPTTWYSGIALVAPGGPWPRVVWSKFNGAKKNMMWPGSGSLNQVQFNCSADLTISDVSQIRIENIVFDFGGSHNMELDGVDASEFWMGVVNTGITKPALKLNGSHERSNSGNQYHTLILEGGNEGLALGNNSYDGVGNCTPRFTTVNQFGEVWAFADSQPTGMYTALDFIGCDDSNIFGEVVLEKTTDITSMQGIVFNSASTTVDMVSDNEWIGSFTASGPQLNCNFVVFNPSIGNHVVLNGTQCTSDYSVTPWSGHTEFTLEQLGYNVGKPGYQYTITPVLLLNRGLPVIRFYQDNVYKWAEYVDASAYLRIDDETTGQHPFHLVPGAPTDSLFVNGAGNVYAGTTGSPGFLKTGSGGFYIAGSSSGSSQIDTVAAGGGHVTIPALTGTAAVTGANQDVTFNTVGTGSHTVYRCTMTGTLPVGALTIAAGNCGASTDTGLRVK
jgi:hypothetical protein